MYVCAMEALRLPEPNLVRCSVRGRRTKGWEDVALADTPPWRSLEVCRWCVLLRSTDCDVSRLDEFMGCV